MVSCVGVMKDCRASVSAMRPNMRYVRRPSGLEATRKVPLVLKHACWRKVASPQRERVSMATWAWEAAKTAFMVGMYWEGSESETERTRMRAFMGGGGAVALLIREARGLLSEEDEPLSA